jgi:hypothetical protein
MADLRRPLLLSARGLLALSGVLGFAALDHMRSLASYGFICGGAVPHCWACPASLAALVGGLALLVLAHQADRAASGQTVAARAGSRRTS